MMVPPSALYQARILVVDDEPANVKLLEKMLGASGYTQVVGTTEPREGLKIYENSPVDLVLLDLNMPQLDGFQFLAHLRDSFVTDYPPVLVLTAQIDRESRLRALEAGARDFVTKPFDRLELMSRIRNMLEVRLLHNAVKDQNAVLEQKVQERTQELHDTRLEIIRRLGRAAEYRDNETGLHIIRMSKTSYHLGRVWGLSSTQCELLLDASPMHDIGKIGIPDRILLKPGKLEPEEFEIMKTHTTIGAELLDGHDSELMTLAREIALTHHERWNGTGYPRGLRGEDIPLGGRIVALADVFDALTSERPYKKAWTVERAVNYIKENRGTHFDPHLADLFLDELPVILDIKEAYAEPNSSAGRPAALFASPCT